MSHIFGTDNINLSFSADQLKIAQDEGAIHKSLCHLNSISRN